MRYSLNDFENYIRNNKLEKLSSAIELKLKTLQQELSCIIENESYFVGD